MTGKKLFAACLLGWFVLILCHGCASSKAQPSVSSDYKKVMAMQQKKAQAVRVQEADLPAGYEATAETYETLGDAHVMRGDLTAAFAEYQRSLEKDPLNHSVRYKLGMLYLDRELPEEAIAAFDRVIAADSENALAHYGRGRARFMQKKLEAAGIDLREALKRDARLWQAHALLGVIYDAEKNHSDAREEYQKALKIQPNASAVYNDLGVSLYLSGKFRESAEAFLRAFDLNPEDRRVCNNLGLALYRLGNTEGALEAFKRGGSESAAYNNVGYLLMKDKKYTEALAALEKAIELNPSHYDRGRKNLEKVKAELGKTRLQPLSAEAD
jgi:Flp pilus assembly protein TadD